MAGKIWIIAAVLLLFTVGATVVGWVLVTQIQDPDPIPNTPEPVPVDDVEPVHDNPDDTPTRWYTVDVPDGWVFHDDGDEGVLWADALLADLSDGMVGPSFAHTYTDPVSIQQSFIPTQIIVTATPTAFTLEEYAVFEAEALEALEPLYGMEVTTTRHGGATLSGMPGTFTEYEMTIQDISFMVGTAITLKDGVVYSVGLAGGDGYSAAFPHFERAVESFEIIPGGTPAWDAP